MTETSDISQRTISGQEAMFRLAERDHGITRQRLHLETGIAISTLKSWANGTAMPVYGLNILAAKSSIPDELLSLVTEPGGKSLCDSAPDETDLDDLAQAAIEVLGRYVAARHPNSPGNIRIVHSETDDIRRSARGLANKAQGIAA